MIATTPRALEEARRASVERRWPRHRWDSQGRSRWAGWDWRNYLYPIIGGLLISGTVLESALSSHGSPQPWWPFGLLAESSAGRGLLVLLILANSWLVDRNLADRTPGESLVPMWLLWLRRTLVGIPVVGLCGIPAWRWIVQARPSWVFRSVALPHLHLAVPSGPATGPLSRLRARSRTVLRGQGQSLPSLLLWMIACQIAPWIALLSWITTAETLSAGRREILLALSVICHVLACLFGLQYGVFRTRQIHAVRWKAAAVRWAPISFLFPFPFFILGILLWMIWSGEEAETLVGRIYSNKSRPQVRIPLGTGFSARRLFRSWIGIRRELDVALNDLLPGTLENSEVKSRQLAFFRLKTFTLILDAAALSWLLVKLGGPSLSFHSPYRYFAPFLVLAALGVIVELFFLTLRVAGWLLRRPMPYQPYGRSLTFTQLALAAGLLLGPILAAGEASNAGLLLVVIGLGTAIASTLLFGPVSFLLMLPGRQVFVLLAWVGLFFELFVTGLVIGYNPELAPPFLRLFTVAVVLTPVWSLALFAGLNGWLLRPFEIGHIFDQRLPGRTRSLLFAVALTALVPLGGIAVPFWIYAHHRRWPRHERLLWNLNGASATRR